MFSSITRQLKRAGSAGKSVLALAGTAAAGLEARLTPFLKEGEGLGVEPLMLTLVRWLQGGHDRLEEREVAQLQAERHLKKLRLARDDRQKALYSLLFRIRKTFDDAFGHGTAAIYLGLEAKLHELDPVALRRVAKEAMRLLSDPAFTTPEPKYEGLWKNPAQYAEKIGELLQPLEAVLDEIEAQKREVEKALKAKLDLLTRLQDRLTWSIRLFEAIYRLADLGFHADRLRLTVASRPSAGEDEESSSSEAGEAGSVEEASADASDASDSASAG